MKGTITIGSREVGMLANAASPYIYKHIFHEDFLAKLQADNPETDLFQKMAYVMTMQNEHEKMSDLLKLNEDGFYEWLMDFDPMDLLYATDEISKLYLAQKESTSIPKEKGE